MSVMMVAVSIFYQMVITTARMRAVNHENAIAVEAARAVVESMRNEDFVEIYAVFNEDPADDPGGPGTAVGHRFAVDGLVPIVGSPDGLVGEVMFPDLEVMVQVGGGGTGGGGLIGGVVGGGGVQVPDLQLREDAQDPDLGMPRDLNGDSLVDDEDHADDYILLPVRVRIEWEGMFGNRRFELFTQLGEFRK